VVRTSEPFTRFLLDVGADLDPNTPQNKRHEYSQIEKVREALQRIPQPISSRELFQSVRRKIYKLADLTAILRDLCHSGEAIALPAGKSTLFWPQNRAFPKRSKE
jgi:hypothetical protein